MQTVLRVPGCSTQGLVSGNCRDQEFIFHYGLLLGYDYCKYNVRNVCCTCKLVNFLAEDRIPEKEILFFATAEKTIKLLD